MNNQNILQNLNDPKIRKEIAKEKFSIFFPLYFGHHMSYEFAPMHKEIFQICENTDIQLGIIMAFRGSAKSTIVSTAFPLWAILGKQQLKYILILAKTKQQAKQIMRNIKSELEGNVELRTDLGPFKEDGDEWGSESIEFGKYGSRITVASIEQSLKGLRHKNYRPQLIITDDIEDNESTKSREMREKTYDKYKRDIVPLGDKGTRILHVGNMLHENALLSRLAREIPEASTKQVFKKFPIVDEFGEPLWSSKFPTKEDVENERVKVNDDVAWHLEYLLEVISTQAQIFSRNEIQLYDKLPAKFRNREGYYDERTIVVGIDLAIKQNDTSDYTVLCPVMVQRNSNGKFEVYVLPELQIQRMDVNEICKSIINLSKVLSIYDPSRIEFISEDVGFQSAIPQFVKSMDSGRGVNIIERKVTTDKEARLRLCKSYFSNQSIYFPRNNPNAQIMIDQLVGFGKERHDDAADALSLTLNHITENYLVQNRIYCV